MRLFEFDKVDDDGYRIPRAHRDEVIFNEGNESLSKAKFVMPKKIRDASIKVASTIKGVAGDMWGGSWSITPQNDITIFVEKKFVDSCMKHKMFDEISKLIEHEYYECKRTVILAREKYPNLNPYAMAEQDTNLGGMAHFLTVKEHDKMTERAYNQMLDKLYTKLGL